VPRLTSRPLRFLVVGCSTVVLDTGLLVVLHGVFGVWLPIATAVSFIATLGWNFGLNHVWTFGADGAVPRRFGRYLVVVAGNLVVTIALVTGLTAVGLNYVASKLVAVAVVAIVNYVVYREWVFAST
jgi:putative flippase GtrA